MKELNMQMIQYHFQVQLSTLPVAVCFGDVTDADGRTDGQTTRKDRATQLLICEALSFTIRGNPQNVNSPVPILILKFRILHQLPLDHKGLNVVYWVNVVHGVYHHLPHLFEALVRSQAGHSIALKPHSVK